MWSPSSAAEQYPRASAIYVVRVEAYEPVPADDKGSGVASGASVRHWWGPVEGFLLTKRRCGGR